MGIMNILTTTHLVLREKSLQKVRQHDGHHYYTCAQIMKAQPAVIFTQANDLKLPGQLCLPATLQLNN